MGDIVQQRNIGALLAAVTSVEPQSSTGATINGASIDRQAHSMPGSCLLHQIVGAVSGSPTGLSCQAILQHCQDNSTWVNYLYDGVNTAETAALAGTGSNQENSVAVDLTLADRYIRVSLVLSLTGGTSPAALVASDVILGGENTLAAV